LRPVSGEEEEMVCPKCGFKTKKIEVDARKESNIKATQDVSLKVMEGDSVEALPTTSIDCPQCKNETAFWWMLQTRSADEATTQFYRCTKCNHTWRNYA
jgi:DNA-directed RNA polymerase subunit M